MACLGPKGCGVCRTLQQPAAFRCLGLHLVPNKLDKRRLVLGRLGKRDGDAQNLETSLASPGHPRKHCNSQLATACQETTRPKEERHKEQQKPLLQAAARSHFQRSQWAVEGCRHSHCIHVSYTTRGPEQRREGTGPNSIYSASSKPSAGRGPHTAAFLVNGHVSGL